MMYESNKIKTGFLQFFPMLIGLSILIQTLRSVIPDFSLSITQLCLGLFSSVLFITITLVIWRKFKIVCIGKSKILIADHRKEYEYTWLDVEEISLDRFFGIYKLKIREKPHIYFSSYGAVTWLFGDVSDMGMIIEKMKRELDL
ncbi:MAG: hypothetical protein RIE59_19465 [Imperialibacter sp.]